MAYTSSVNIRLGEVPKTSNGEIFADLVDVYNAIHILAQYTSQLVDRANPGLEGAPWDQMPFDNIFSLPAGVSISAGQIICVSNGVAFLGASATWPMLNVREINEAGDTENYTANPGGLANVWGIALSDAAPGELVKLGVGPAILRVGGVPAGSVMYAATMYDSKWDVVGFGRIKTPLADTRLSNDGGLYISPADYIVDGYNGMALWQRGYNRIGYAVSAEAVYIQPTGNYAPGGVSRSVAWA